MGKVIPFMRKIPQTKAKDSVQLAITEQTLVDNFASSLREAFTQEELDDIARELDAEPPTEE